MAVFSGGEKGEMAIRLIGMVGKSVNYESENWVGGRKWEGFTRMPVARYRFVSYTLQVASSRLHVPGYKTLSGVEGSAQETERSRGLRVPFKILKLCCHNGLQLIT